MTAINQRRTGISAADIKAGLPVRGLTQTDLARLTHWALGRGMQIIPSASLNGNGITLAKNSDYTLAYRVRPRYQALERVWWFDIEAAAAASVDITINGGTAVTVRPGGLGWVHRPIAVPEVLVSQGDAETANTVKFDVTNAADAVLRSVSCFEIPRAALAATVNDDGTALNRFTASQAIDESDFVNIADVLSDEAKIGRRTHLQWAVPYLDGGSPTTAFAEAVTSSSYVDVFDLPVPVLARKVARADTTGTITAKFLAWVSANNADIRLDSSENGASSAVNITTTTPAWSNAVTLDVDCTYHFSGIGDGLQTWASPNWDELDIEARQNTSGTLYIAGVSIWED